jgi:hypothetical protein
LRPALVAITKGGPKPAMALANDNAGEQMSDDRGQRSDD